MLACDQDAGGLPRSLPESQGAFFSQSNCFKTDTETYARGCAKDGRVAGRRQTPCAHVKGWAAFWGCRGALMNQILLLQLHHQGGGHGGKEVEGCIQTTQQDRMESLLFWVTRTINYSVWEWLDKCLNFRPLFKRVSGRDYSSMFPCGPGETRGHLHHLRVSPARVS